MIDEGHIEELAAARALGALLPEEEAQVDRHVDLCPPCKTMLREAEEAASLLALTVQPIRPSHRCKERLMAAIEREQPSRAARRAARVLQAAPLAGRAVLPVWAMRFATLTALVGLLIWNVALQRQVANARRMQYMVVTDHQPVALKPQATLGPEVTARMFEGPNGDDAVLVIENLPSLPPGKVYKVWIANEQQQRAMHTFQVAHTVEQFLMQMEEPLSKYKWVMITVEDDGSGPSPSKHTILLGDL
jgi:anti-sigma-K factor RskA